MGIHADMPAPFPTHFPDFESYTQERLSAGLPGQDAQFQMAPLDRQDHLQASVRDKSCREAAVLALFYPGSDGHAHLLLTVRPSGMNQHAGQVALPGGRREEAESLEATALRETHEEVGIPPDRIRMTGALTPLYVIPSNFCVYPFVGFMDDPADLAYRSDEVADMFGVPVPNLVAPDSRTSHTRTLAGRPRDVPHFRFDGYRVWGATAMMLSELAAILHPELMRY